MINVLFHYFFQDEQQLNDTNENINALEYQENEDTGTFPDQIVDP